MSTTISTAEQLRRRREASYRLPPLDCGHRDPEDCLTGCGPQSDNEETGPSELLLELAEQIEPGDVVALWASAKSLFFAHDFPAYASLEWRQLGPDDPRRLAAALDAAEKWRKYGTDVTQWLEEASAPKPPIWTGRTQAELDEAAKPKPSHVLRATPGWPPIAIPGQPGRYLTHAQEMAA
ncbi:hypothetical protein [Streptomyces sp. SID8374]|uniref:hypothetical protein n=1 Tax=Streptomyces sp. SID8374 TaxID=2690354 RepID=UPI001F362B3F|nr:hypothetical protein [Streptomyces sp. SID8374]